MVIMKLNIDVFFNLLVLSVHNLLFVYVKIIEFIKLKSRLRVRSNIL